MQTKDVVIVGGGFAGLSCAKKLAGLRGFSVTLIDRRNHHLFQPLLYQVATAGLSPAEIASPIRSVFSRARNVRVLLGNVTGIDLAGRYLELPGERISYDYLVLACGAKHSYFGHDEWEESAPGLKTLQQATEIRRRILMAFELAEKEGDESRREALLTFVIVGAGPTGVELAGALSEIASHTLSRDFRSVDLRQTRILLIEAGPRVLPAFDPSLSQKALKDLAQLHVQTLLGTRVVDVNSEGVRVAEEKGERFIPSKTVIWAAGVLPSSLCRVLGTPLDKAGRVIVERELNLKNHPEVFVLGDMAHTPDGKGGALPGLAPVAMQEGRHTAKNIRRLSKGLKPLEFRYLDKGQMATIGRSRAIVQYRGIRVSGFPAWVMWLVVHIYYLIGFKNKFFVLLDWAWAYITFKRGARLI
jgi:NADH dehydrogenase